MRGQLQRDRARRGIAPRWQPSDSGQPSLNEFLGDEMKRAKLAIFRHGRKIPTINTNTPLGLWVGKGKGCRFLPWSVLTPREKMHALRIRNSLVKAVRIRESYLTQTERRR